MSRSRSRPCTSRFLLVILALTVCVGVITFAYRYRQNSAKAEAAGPAPAAQASTGAVLADDLDAVITTAPTTPAAPAGAKPVTATAPAVTKPSAAPTAASRKSLADAKAKADAGKLLEARDLYNAAVTSGKLSPAEATAAKQELAALNDTLVFSPSTVEGDAWGGKFTVPSGGVLAKIAKRFDITPELLARINDISD